MWRKLILPGLAVAGVIFAVWTVIEGAQAVPPARPVVEPTEAPFPRNIAGAGIVEAATENIAVGPVVPGVVTEVMVQVGDSVRRGDPLFRVDDRDLRAELLRAKAARAAAEARLARLRSLPRPEEIPPAEAAVRADEQQLADARNQLAIVERVVAREARAVSVEDVDRRRFAVSVAEARLARSKAELALLLAGSWASDIAVQEAELATAAASIEALEVELERRITRSPIDGKVLQLKVRPGEYAPAGPLATPLALLGSVARLHVRVDVDENDAWRITPGARAEATIRGNRELKTDLEFVRIEPYVIPKRSLTGESTERVDTRVLQVVYSFDPARLPNVYVGQQMDVFVQSER